MPGRDIDRCQIGSRQEGVIFPGVRVACECASPVEVHEGPGRYAPRKPFPARGDRYLALTSLVTDDHDNGENSWLTEIHKGVVFDLNAENPLHTRVCEVLDCRFPVLQAGMGGVARSELVSAVTEAGGYGFLGMVRESPELIAREIDAVRACTAAPFGVNLIPAATDAGLFQEELAVCFEKRVHSLCFFWSLDENAIALAKAAGCRVVYQVGSVEAGVAAERAGADLIIAQGVEAGGHLHGKVSSLVLIPQLVRAVHLPVIASGGFASGQSLVAAFALGAEAIHCGTAFIATTESFAHDYYKQRIVAARSEDTVYTDAFAINWPADSPVRVIANSVIESLGPELLGHDPEGMGRETVAVEEGRSIYRFSTDSPTRLMTGDLESLALFAGQVAGSIDGVVGAADRIDAIVQSAQQTLQRLADLTKRS